MCFLPSTCGSSSLTHLGLVLPKHSLISRRVLVIAKDANGLGSNFTNASSFYIYFLNQLWIIMQVNFQGFKLMDSRWLCKGDHVWIRVTAGFCRQSDHNHHVSVFVRLFQRLLDGFVNLSCFFKFSDVFYPLPLLLS